MSDYQSKYFKKENIAGKEYNIIDIKKAASDYGFKIESLPYSLRVLFENVVRNNGSKESLLAFKGWAQNKKSFEEINYFPSRILMQDFTGLPAVVDLASMRDAIKTIGGDPYKINPSIPVDLVIDHSVQVDFFGEKSSFQDNVNKEMERNSERYRFLKWGQANFSNLRVVPPGTGICHQVNLESLAKCVCINDGKEPQLYPDTLVGTDSHTTMINSLSVLGWGVGGIEAEAAMLGQPLPMVLPEVIGCKLVGRLLGTITATDLVLTVTHKLREKGVVGKFVEFFGEGVSSLALADRATISNMSPEYGATCGFFAVDDETLKYLRLTGRTSDHIQVVEEYAKMQGLWQDGRDPEYTDIVEIDISKVVPSVAGPQRPQDKINLSDMQDSFFHHIEDTIGDKKALSHKYPIAKSESKIGHGDIVIAAITSCTNTSNPSVMIAAGLVAKKATELGLEVQPWVKTSLAPGSQVVTEYLERSGLREHLDKLGFNLVGYGCTTCIGNSGPLGSAIDQVINDNKLIVASVLSGNRNFEGRIHPNIKANYLASPPLVVAYALAGTININIDRDPIARTSHGKHIYLEDLWPTKEEIQYYIEKTLKPEIFIEKYEHIFQGDKNWQKIPAVKTSTYPWDKTNTYINNPPYFKDINQPRKPLSNIKEARILALFGDSITTDHISPAGRISLSTPAAKFLISEGVLPRDFNSYGSRRGNHEVMMRGTFANVRIKNKMCEGTEGGITVYQDTGERMSIYDAAMKYQESNTPLVILAGKEYGTGSSRDWAAKGTKLLGVKAVIAESFERIHRSNLVGMGVLPITFDKNTIGDLNLTGSEKISILGISDNMEPDQSLKLLIESEDKHQSIDVTLQAHTDNEIDYIKQDNILSFVIKNLIKK